MEFTYKAYSKLIDNIRNNGYRITGYDDYESHEKVAIMRHDVDYDIRRVLNFAEIEYRKGIKSTYFVLCSSDFYNLYSKRGEYIIRKLKEYGHEIGLHFDEVKYDIDNDNWSCDKIESLVKDEAKVLSEITGDEIRVVSMHRPSQKTLQYSKSGELKFDGMINSYDREFFDNFKYVSDSRMRWREDVESIIESGEYDKIHVLTHPFWYGKENKNIKYTVQDFLISAVSDRMKILNDNITDLYKILEDDF